MEEDFALWRLVHAGVAAAIRVAARGSPPRVAARIPATFRERRPAVRQRLQKHVYVTTVDQNGIPHLLSKRQITDYHQEVFRSHGFPDYTFGGAPYGDDSLGGRAFEDFVGAAFWCPDCDKVP